MSLRHYYDEVLLINKVNMSYEPALAKRLCEKFRVDALTVFFFRDSNVVSQMCCSQQIQALALAQEVESNHERYGGVKEKEYKAGAQQQATPTSRNAAKRVKEPKF